ncbi:hypothetical protein K8I85_13850, partial [bacterium]|nr:hypothetical protein [bacterium]
MASTGTRARGGRSPGQLSPATPEEEAGEAGSRSAAPPRQGSLLPFVAIASLFVLVTITLNVSATLRRTLERELGGRLRGDAELAGDVLAAHPAGTPADDAALLARLEE